MITVAEKTQLEELGFRVEDMHEAWGPGWWDGMFRWIRTGTDEFQETEPCENEDEVWASALQYAKQMGYMA